MLDYTIKLFESQGLGKEYYGYHNITHELEVTYVSLIVLKWKSILNNVREEDFKYLYAAALFHDFDPQKSVDKPHEENVIKFLTHDQNVKQLCQDANLDIDIIKALILRTTYPWIGQYKEHAEEQITECFANSPITKDDHLMQEYYMRLGWLLSVIDRVSGYALGDFTKAMDMAKKNAHALAWHPSYIVRRAVGYFEDLLNEEAEMCDTVLRALPKDMRKNFMDTVTGFLNLRQQEIKIQSDYLYENLRLVPKIESMMAEYLRPIEVSAETLALDAIAEVGPGGHFFGAQHTMSRYQTAFYQPFLSERRNFEAWQEAGSQGAEQRANRIWKELLETYQPPPLDPVVDEELQDYVAQRKGGAAPE